MLGPLQFAEGSMTALLPSANETVLGPLQFAKGSMTAQLPSANGTVLGPLQFAKGSMAAHPSANGTVLGLSEFADGSTMAASSEEEGKWEKGLVQGSGNASENEQGEVSMLTLAGLVWSFTSCSILVGGKLSIELQEDFCRISCSF
mmetsp:Transcript_18784/g.31558  ORF Transcript_18784/g.31558 Transcript_18784/m.31558 type:complete len:146 (-) Transcript_18784:154-591(-)